MQDIIASIPIKILDEQGAHIAIHRINLIKADKPGCSPGTGGEEADVGRNTVDDSRIRLSVTREVCHDQLPRACARRDFSTEDQFS